MTLRFKTLTIQELTALTRTAYLLKTIPEGFTLQYVAANDQPKDQPPSETDYTSTNGETFDLMAIGLDPTRVLKNESLRWQLQIGLWPGGVLQHLQVIRIQPRPS